LSTNTTSTVACWASARGRATTATAAARVRVSSAASATGSRLMGVLASFRAGQDGEEAYERVPPLETIGHCHSQSD
jgi:hypothetical protein